MLNLIEHYVMWRIKYVSPTFIKLIRYESKVNLTATNGNMFTERGCWYSSPHDIKIT